MKLNGKVWADRIKVLFISGLFASIANTIYLWRLHMDMYLPWEVWPGMLFMIVLALFSCLVHDLLEPVLPFQVPIVLYVTLFATILSFPFCGALNQMYVSTTAPIQTMPLCTPILAYAGISGGKELKTFKEQGIAIIVVALITFFGTYIGSAVIAEVILRATGVI